VHVINLQGSKYSVLTQLSPVLFYVYTGAYLHAKDSECGECFL
jgi:hypothetical protein